MTTTAETFICRDCKKEIVKYKINNFLVSLELCTGCYNNRRKEQEDEMYSSGTYKKLDYKKI